MLFGWFWNVLEDLWCEVVLCLWIQVCPRRDHGVCVCIFAEQGMEVAECTRDSCVKTAESVLQVAKMVEGHMNPLNAYLNTMHVKIDVPGLYIVGLIKRNEYSILI